MKINTLPTELLKQIFKKITYERKCVQHANFRQIALQEMECNNYSDDLKRNGNNRFLKNREKYSIQLL